MAEKHTSIVGLTTDEALKLQKQFGKNELSSQKKESFFVKAFHIICEPMFLLLLMAALIYFILGEPRDGAIMLIFVVGIISIDIIQEYKTDKTLNALKDLSAPQVTVIRDGVEKIIPSVDLVPGDCMLIYEGVKIPADGVIVKCNGLCVDESSLTGEAEAVWKVSNDVVENDGDYWHKDYCYAGTMAIQGTARVIVDKIGAMTEYGKIGSHIVTAPDEKTPLQKQTDSLVKVCAGIAAVLFILVALFTFMNLAGLPTSERIIESILSGITLAMAMIPEEFPVILTVFLSMGAWRLAKKNSLVRKLPSVETLGEVSVLCVDKTGTITMNQMSVDQTWSVNNDTHHLLHIMGMACQSDTYDPMEKAMLQKCEQEGISSDSLFEGNLIKEYPFTNETKRMGHVWKNGENIIVAVKGSPEKVMEVCTLSSYERELIEKKMNEYSSDGLRVIAVAELLLSNEREVPSDLNHANLKLIGLVGLVDPPRESVKNDIEVCNKAGIRVVMITGDNGVTAAAIAKKIGILNYDHYITGEMLDKMSDEELKEKVKEVNIFSRVVPEHKMRIVKAFKENGEIVAMTGDGVNDAAALKYADIGIAMGKRGSEVSREAADLILMDDNFTTIVETVKDGRRIYDNIRKAIGYVFVIHIPIAFSSLGAPMLGIASDSLFLFPLHVVLLELVIDPTCSVVLERQPAESDIMDRKPRSPKEKILTKHVLIKSIIQGLCIFVASFLTYYSVLEGNVLNASLARSMGLTIIVLANLFLVQVNSSETDYAFTSIRRLASDKVMWMVSVITIAAILLVLYTPLSGILKLASLSVTQLATVVALAFISTFWYEIVKFINKHRKNK